MRKMTLVPNKEKELEKVEKLLKQAEEKSRV